MDDVYTEQEWSESVVGRPLADLSYERCMTLHRHWIWANSAFRWFQKELGGPAPSEVDLASDRSFSMYLWYSLLWSVIEGVQKHPVVIKGPFRDDLRKVREGLKHARNAVMHVSLDAYYDDRLFEIMAEADSAVRVRRVHRGYGRLLLSDLRARR